MVEPGGNPLSPSMVYRPLPGFDPAWELRRLQSTSQLGQVYEEFSKVLMLIFQRSLAPPDGLERPNAFETGFADHLIPIAASRRQGTIQGSTNLRYLSGPYFYNENNGAFGVRCNLLSDSMPNTVLSIQISPASGSFALIRNHSMVPNAQDESLPNQLFLGSNAGIEAFHRLHDGVTVGMRLYARAELDVSRGSSGVGGVADYEAAYLKFDIQEMINGHMDIPVSVMLLAQHFNRGAHRSVIYDFDEGTPRGAELIQSGVEGMLTISFAL